MGEIIFHINQTKMKATFLTILLCVIGLSNSFSQTVNGVPLKDVDVEYVQIIGHQKFMSTKVIIDIDFGQRNSIWTGKDTQLRDENGKKLVLNSMIDALNFMTANGYEFIQANFFSVSNQNAYHYLLKKNPDNKKLLHVALKNNLYLIFMKLMKVKNYW